MFAEAAYPPITYRHLHHIFTIDPDSYPHWRDTEHVWTWNGKQIDPDPAWRVDGDTVPQLPNGVRLEKRPVWNTKAIGESLNSRIGSAINREPGSVTVSYSATGGVLFDGVGMLGQYIDKEQIAQLTIRAMEIGASDVIIPMTFVQPEMTVLDPELRKRGIQEVVTVGESNFAGSTLNRRHNIATGLSKFNGAVIAQGSLFSFNDILGPVNGATGYRKELVILGDKTLPEYGGGLCQVSTTAYRGIWEYGFPIEQRKNHSFAVQYYGPQGTDATIYPPVADMKFTNDGPSDLLIQTHMEGDNAYFIYYGTRDARSAHIVGPYTWDKVGIPADRVEYTDEIPAGTTRKVGSPVPGMKSAWFRIVHKSEQDSLVEGTYSTYQARPLYTQIGVESGESGQGTQIHVPPLEEPEWIDEPVETIRPPSVQPNPVDNNPYGRPSRRSIRRGY